MHNSRRDLANFAVLIGWHSVRLLPLSAPPPPCMTDARASSRIKEIAQRLGFRPLDAEARARRKRDALAGLERDNHKDSDFDANLDLSRQTDEELVEQEVGKKRKKSVAALALPKSNTTFEQFLTAVRPRSPPPGQAARVVSDRGPFAPIGGAGCGSADGIEFLRSHGLPQRRSGSVPVSCQAFLCRVWVRGQCGFRPVRFCGRGVFRVV